MANLYTPDHIRRSHRRTGLWLIGTGLYGALATLALTVAILAR